VKYWRFAVFTAFVLLLAPGAVRAAGVQATLDRSTVQLGDTVTLNLQVDGGGGGISMPDLQPLQQDFTILGTSQNRSISVVNGQASSTLTIGVALRPNHVGTLRIPALDVGGSRTAPLQLVVDAPNPNQAAAANRDVFMQAQVTPAQGYVGEQFSYVVRLYYAVNINSGALSAPNVDGMDVRKLGDDLNYDTQRGGRDYHVLERRYALTPQHAGRIGIPAASFQGEIADPMDPNSFFGSSTPVSASAPGVSIDVQAAPAGWGNADWLPARQLTLSLEGWPGAQDHLRVGQSLTLTMTLRATGLPAEALPALSLPSVAGASVYPGKTDSSTRPDGQWLLGQRQRVFAVVPDRAGTLTIPATTVKWWNVLGQRMEVAEIPAHSVPVLPALGANGAPSPAASPAAASSTPAASDGVRAPVASWPWRWIALAAAATGLLGILAWWWRRRRGVRGPAPASASARAPGRKGAPAPAPTVPSARQGRLRFLAAARSGNAGAQARSLLAWARAERPAILSLGDLLGMLDAAPQRDAIAGLQRRMYAGGLPAAGSVDLVRVFKRGFAWKKPAGAGQGPGLPPLYPFDLH